MDYNDIIIESNVIDNKETEHTIFKTVTMISDILSHTLGPMGNNTIIQGIGNNHIITKDGYEVFKNLKLKNDISRVVYDLIKKVCRNQVNEVGDGSTTSIIIACELYNFISVIKDNYLVPSKLVTLTLNLIKDILCEEINSLSIKISNKDKDILTKVATIANNNDIKLGKLIADLYCKIGENGFINIETKNNNKTNEDKIEFLDGYSFDSGYIDNIFLDNRNSDSWVEEKPYIFICNDKLDDDDLELLKDIISPILSEQRSLVIIAKEYSPEVYNFLKINKNINKNNLKICAITVPLIKDIHYEYLDDFSVYVGCKLYDKHFSNIQLTKNDNISEYIGICRKATISKNSSNFIEGNYITDIYKERIESIEKLIDKYNAEGIVSDDRIFETKKRLSKLMTKIATINVAGYTDDERNNRKYLIEDSIYACKSLLKNGYVLGGNLSIPIILINKYDEIIKTLKDTLSQLGYSYFIDEENNEFLNQLLDGIINSCIYPYRNVLYNSFKDDEYVDDIINKSIKDQMIFNVINNKYESINETNVINPTNTDIEIINSAFSIIGLLLTSNQFISRDFTNSSNSNNIVTQK